MKKTRARRRDNDEQISNAKPEAAKCAPRRPEAPQGRSRGPPRKSRGAPAEKNGPRQETAAGFGPEIQFSHLSPAISLILSGVSQNEVSFGKKQGKLNKQNIKQKRGKTMVFYLGKPVPPAEFCPRVSFP